MQAVERTSGAPEKKPYQTPTLVRFGSLADLTASGSGGGIEQSATCDPWGQVKKGGASVKGCF
jgi:hypothetical protein